VFSGEGLKRQDFYRPTDSGLEKRIAERMVEWDRLRKSRSR
jgi:hypothetical protein